MNVKRLTIIACSLSIIACRDEPGDKAATISAAQYNRLDSTAWLLGTWTDSSKTGKATETWQKENDSTYVAESFIIAQTDTIFFEQVMLEERNRAIHYIAKSRGQNDDEAVSFRLVSDNMNTLVFENRQHDFPTKITYTKIGKDSLYAEISGLSKGQERKVGFPFKKRNP